MKTLIIILTVLLLSVSCKTTEPVKPGPKRINQERY